MNFTFPQQHQQRTSPPPLPTVLNLVLYSPGNEAYDAMRDIQREHLRRHNNSSSSSIGSTMIRQFFYWFDPDLGCEFEVRGSDELVFRGMETFVPGILEKTLRAIEVALHLFPFDYLLRTNVSTICNYAKLVTCLAGTTTTTPKIAYGGSYVNTLRWLDPPAGIVDKSRWGLRFVSGTGIVLSRASCRRLVEAAGKNKKEGSSSSSKIDFSLVDDVALGDFFARQYGNAAAVDFGDHGFRFVGGATAQVADVLFYRNRLPGDDRAKDVAVMRQLVSSWK